MSKNDMKAEIAERRQDTAFTDRLAERMRADKNLLARLNGEDPYAFWPGGTREDKRKHPGQD